VPAAFLKKCRLLVLQIFQNAMAQPTTELPAHILWLASPEKGASRNPHDSV
jgi:hypothetical protein